MAGKAYYRHRHVQTTTVAANSELVVQLPTPIGAGADNSKQLWALCGITLSSDAQTGTQTSLCTIRFGNASGWTNDDSIVQFAKVAIALTGPVDWGTSQFLNDPTVFVPASDGKIYLDILFNNGAAHAYSIDLTFQQIVGGTVATTA